MIWGCLAPEEATSQRARTMSLAGPRLQGVAKQLYVRDAFAKIEALLLRGTTMSEPQVDPALASVHSTLVPAPLCARRQDNGRRAITPTQDNYVAWSQRQLGHPRLSEPPAVPVHADPSGKRRDARDLPHQVRRHAAAVTASWPCHDLRSMRRHRHAQAHSIGSGSYASDLRSEDVCFRNILRNHSGAGNRFPRSQ